MGLLLVLAAPAMAAGRVPKGVSKISVRLTFPLNQPNAHKPVRKTLTKTATVAQLVSATNALQTSTKAGICPMIVRLAPVLTVVFRSASGATLAEATTQATLGSRGNDGSNSCFPIRYSSPGKSAALLGNSWIRLVGRLIGTPIS